VTVRYGPLAGQQALASIRVAAGVRARLLKHCASNSSLQGTYDNSNGAKAKCYNNPHKSSSSYVLLNGTCK